jgi:histone H3/H4
MKVLKRLRFADIVRLCKRFGVDRIDQEIKSNFYDDVRDDLSEIMETIHEALARKVT